LLWRFAGTPLLTLPPPQKSLLRPEFEAKKVPQNLKNGAASRISEKSQKSDILKF
jgi:hypothetical protein